MNEETQNETPQVPDFSSEEMKIPENATVAVAPEEKRVSGKLILLLGILLLAILVGLYLWFNAMNNTPTPTPAPPIERPTAEENNEPESTTAEARTEVMETTSTSDDIAAIEADIEATDIEALDAELEAIEAELNAAF